MTLPRTVADVLSRHVSFEVESIDRMYCNVYQPKLQYTAGAAGFFVGHRGFTYASSALMAQMSETFVADLYHFMAAGDVPLVQFAKGQRKDDVTHEYLAGHDGTEQVLFVGRAQEKARVISSTRRRNPATGATYAWLVHTNVLVNHFYVYCYDDDFGPFFIKFCSYFPFTAKLCINGNEWAKRQAAKAGIGFVALDNGFAAVDDPAAVQAICDQLGPEQIDALLRKWLRLLPHPFTVEDQAAGYRYEISILQAEFSLTQMLDRPVSGRIFFEQVPGSPGESHPQAPTDPCVNLSIYTARAVQLSGRVPQLPVREQARGPFPDPPQTCPRFRLAAFQPLVLPHRPTHEMAIYALADRDHRARVEHGEVVRQPRRAGFTSSARSSS